MNVNEFAGLQVGDKIDNPMSRSSGEVVEVVTKNGYRAVRVRWSNGAPGRDVSFTYTGDMTSWFHWTKAE